MIDIHATIKYWRENVSTKPEFLMARTRAEAAAREMLEKKAGSFAENDFEEFFRHCNTERVPPDVHTIKLQDHETHGRLRPAFMGNNKKLLLQSLGGLNTRTVELWESDDSSLEVFENFWSRPKVNGAGISLPSMIMYLKNPDRYAIWLPFLTDALSIIANQKMSKARSLCNYLDYNSKVDQHLRNQYDVRPQEIDYLLFRVGRMTL